ncbi:metallophosphoesterase family protein [Megasphaera cerevisiae]|uniref:metallophosphoesterase family protein n=1 Tax=Megasphaera cerevisiae TaxID=39029 RepID=UPI001F1B9287|nr:metallophosphoesterase family protein [Megasphaera cerevisiae]
MNVVKSMVLTMYDETFIVMFSRIQDTKALPPLQHGDILLHGHTHIPAWEAFGKGNLYLNPGSVSLPKDGSFHSYMMIHKTVLQWKTLDGTVYHRLLLNHQ